MKRGEFPSPDAVHGTAPWQVKLWDTRRIHAIKREWDRERREWLNVERMCAVLKVQERQLRRLIRRKEVVAPVKRRCGWTGHEYWAWPASYVRAVMPSAASN